MISSGINPVVNQEDIVGLDSSDAKPQFLASNKGTKTEEVETDDEGINPYELDMPGAKQQVMR